MRSGAAGTDRSLDGELRLLGGNSGKEERNDNGGQTGRARQL
jgi:hypothetical protein